MSSVESNERFGNVKSLNQRHRLSRRHLSLVALLFFFSCPASASADRRGRSFARLASLRKRPFYDRQIQFKHSLSLASSQLQVYS